ncbi:FAD-binding oxidoreductase [Aspergillus mulundensis]|uniref:FAD-binding PCMH-type domain-containing protein n=1 Tax=Aspergillus mulundensis TaxID=1810919 RepID=A0A3D8RQE6_9EURO|nr:Uncharacterized protein DSM5745_06304 [Aspergillus mulundensis]RDW76312.1 Uncharacterized protein DSM5745_06304 [Aspergillus mulundensis]
MAESAPDTDPFATLRSLVRPDDIISPDSPEYRPSAQTWAAQKQENPGLVIRPASIEALSKVIAHLYTTKLDFAIYGQGFSSASARDVLVNTSAFDDFSFDPQAETITIGAGQAWSEVYRKLEEVAPEYGVVGARTPCVGVAGTILSGGYSWLSSEYGCISDPANMLDAKVVKFDGSVVWASTEPELLWALRGGGGGFGVLVQVKLRVFRYPQDIWAGPILLPREALEQVAKGIESFLAGPVDPKITMFLYVVTGRLLESIGSDSDMLVVHAFDANGEEHGRESFAWALDIPGAVDQTKLKTLAGVAALQNKAGTVKGTMKQFWQPLMLSDISQETVIKAVQWFEEIKDVDPSFGECTYLIFELLSSVGVIQQFQQVSDTKRPSLQKQRDQAGGAASSAWPRQDGLKHILLLGTGCPSDAGPYKEKLARDLAIEAPSRVLGDNARFQVLPNGLEEYHDRREVWGAHYEKLQSLRARFDPSGRFKGAIGA